MLNLGFVDLAALGVVVWLGAVIYGRVSAPSRTTRLKGPPRKSWFWGYTRELLDQLTSGAAFEGWASKYGSCFLLPAELGRELLILTDPKAIAHVFQTNSHNYHRPEGFRAMGKKNARRRYFELGRFRKALNPGFTPQALRQFIPTFLESAHKVEEAWNAMLADQNGSALTIDVQSWMNCITLDTIGLTGFSHNFGTLCGERPPVLEVLATFGSQRLNFFSALTFLLVNTVPQVLSLPSPRNKLFTALNDSMSEVVKKVLDNARKDKTVTDDHFSMLGPLMKSEGAQLTTEELSAQMNTLILAGYATTANSLSWCLHELSMHPALQRKIREELALFPEITYEQLQSQTPVLEAVVRETFRTHPPVTDHTSYSVEDDCIPLCQPLTTAGGEIVDHIDVAAGTVITIGIEAVNRSRHVWGPTAHEFDPDRWLKGDLPELAQEVQGYHHMLTFIDDPRHCIGKIFAVLEFKVQSTLSKIITSG